MKNRDRQRENRRKNPKDDEISFFNHEHYADPTAFYAMKKMENEEKLRREEASRSSRPAGTK